MATLMSCATGNFTAAGTWALCNSNAELDSEASTVGIGTSNVDSAAFQPGAVTVDGVAVKVSQRNRSDSSTVTVTLRNSSDSVDVASTTINITDVHATSVQGWVFFKFASTYLLTAGKNYIVRVVASASSTITLYRDGTSNNVSRQLRTTTTQAPAASDKLIVTGELTGAGTGNSFTVTMDNTASTVFGTVSLPQSLSISQRGTLAYGTSASTSYLLTIAGILRVYSGGVLTIGTSAARIPSTSTAVLKFSPSVTVDSGMYVDCGTVKAYGDQRTNVWTLLTQDAAVSDTHCHVSSTSGWVTNDEIVLAATGTSPTAADLKTITNVDSSTQVSFSALANAHSGTSPTQGEVILLTRNVTIQGASTSLNAYVVFDVAGATAEFDSVRFTFLGSGTSKKQGVEIREDPTTNAIFTYCAFDQFTHSSATAIYYNWNADANLAVSHCVFYLIGNQAIILNRNAVGTNVSVSDVVIVRSGGMYVLTGSTLTDVRVAGCTAGSHAIWFNAAQTFTVNGAVAHSSTGDGIYFQATVGTASTFANLTFWYCSGYAINNNALQMWLSIDTCTMFGSNSGANIYLANTTFLGRFKGIVSDGSTLQATTYGITIDSQYVVILDLVDCNFSGGASPKAAHTSDINFNGTAGYVRITGDKVLLGAATPIRQADATRLAPESSIRLQRIATNDHRSWYYNGVVRIDSVIYNTATPSERCTPSSASTKLESGACRKPVASGATATFTVYTRKSAAGDTGGANYNGNHQRLVLKRNVSAGITSDTVLDTAADTYGNWEVLTGTSATVSADCVLECVVDCDGTAGWVNVDDWS